MDKTLTKAGRSNRRRRERNYSAWQRFSPDGKRCRHCAHDNTTHLSTSGQPHFYRLATAAEQRDPDLTLYRHDMPSGGSVLVRRVTIARDAELITAFCTACAKERGTHQVLCYQRSLAVGEVVGIEMNNTRAKGATI